MRFKIDGFEFVYAGDFCGPDLMDDDTMKAVISGDRALFDAMIQCENDGELILSAWEFEQYGLDAWVQCRIHEGHGAKEKMFVLSENPYVKEYYRKEIARIARDSEWRIDEDGHEYFYMPTSPGFVYLMYSRKTGHYKIGRSADPKSRLSQIKAKMKDRTIELLHYFGADDHEEAEEQMHEMFAGFRVKPTKTCEWFNLPQGAVFKIQMIEVYEEGEFLYRKGLIT